MPEHVLRISLAFAAAAAALALGALAAGSASAHHIPFARGDVLVGNELVEPYVVRHFTPEGRLLETLDAGVVFGGTMGMCFDGDGALYSTTFNDGTVAKLDRSGALIANPWGPPGLPLPESCAVDARGNVYVGAGEPSGVTELRKLDRDGSLVATYTTALTPDWVVLCPYDDCVLLYTSEAPQVSFFDVCRGLDVGAFTSLPAGRSNALGVRANGETVVAAADGVMRLDIDGSVMMTYEPAARGPYFALALDPDGTSFWVASRRAPIVYRVDIDSGDVLAQFPAFDGPGIVSGLAVFDRA